MIHLPIVVPVLTLHLDSNHQDLVMFDIIPYTSLYKGQSRYFVLIHTIINLAMNPEENHAVEGRSLESERGRP